MPELEHVGKTYADHRVLDDIDLAIEDGQIVSVLGPSGGGETTLLNIFLGITDATDGQILWNGDDITRTPMEKRGFNIVFQACHGAYYAGAKPYLHGNIDVVTTGTVDKPRLDFSSPRWLAFDDHAIFELQLDFVLC